MNSRKALGLALIALAPLLLGADAPVQQFFGVLLYIVAVLGMGIGLAALLVTYVALRPEAVRTHARDLTSRPVRHVSHGLLTAAIVLLAVLVLAPLPDHPVKGTLLLVLAVWTAGLAVRGLAAVAHELGDRVLASLASPRAGAAVANVAVGGVLLALIGLLPFVGWAALLLLVLWGLAPRWGRDRHAARSAPSEGADPEA